MLVLVSFGTLWTRSEWPVGRYNVILLQLRSIILFPVLVFSALWARRSSLGTHKRLMIIATVVLLDAAIARTAWLPGAGGGRSPYEFNSAYQLLLLAPVIVYDLRTLGRVHRASLVGVGLLVISAVIVHVLWGSERLIHGAPRLLGIGS